LPELSRLAWFTPWPPQHSGIAGRSAELVPLLAQRGYALDVFVDEQDPLLASALGRAPSDAPRAGDVRVQSAHDFVWRQLRGQYDLAVYQLGNSRLHEFIWPYLFRWPGLVVLHDARLHHARGRALLRHQRFDDYRAEFAWNHPDVSIDGAELGVKGFNGAYYYQWPMIRGVLEAARGVATHASGALAELREAAPDRLIDYIALGEGPDPFDVASARRTFSARHGLDSNVVVFGVFWALTGEKRVPQILRAFAATRAWSPDARLLLVGRADVQLGLDLHISSLGLGDSVLVIDDDVDDATFDAAIASVDVSLNLRWPTSLETSGPWLRSLALGRASVIVDLAHQAHLPVLDPRTWHRHHPSGDLDTRADARAIAVAIDPLDEDHSLRLAMRRLATDAELRDRLGREARRYWEVEHTIGRMADDYARTIAKVIARSTPSTTMPRRLRPSPTEFTEALLTPFDLALPEFS
jgi:glycosyltransferase involved in cell wall biosynthesis